MEALHDILPAHVLIKVLECIDTKQRAQLAQVCKTWRELVSQSWTSIQLSFTTLAQLQEQRRWLDTVAANGHISVRTIEILWRGGKLLHPAAGSLHVEKFINLEKLYLKPPESAFWAVNGKAVKSLQPLTRLKELVLVYSPSTRPGELVVTLEQFAMFPLLRLLSIVLQPWRGWEPGWRINFSPALQGLKSLESLTLSGAQLLVMSPTLISLCSRLKHLDLHIRESPKQVLSTPKLESLRLICRNAVDRMRNLPFCNFENLQDLHFNGQLQANMLSSELLNLTRLHLDHSSEGDDEELVACLGWLKHLRDLSMVYNIPHGNPHSSENESVPETLSAFTSLTRLESLNLALEGRQTFVELRPSPSLSQLHYLSELRISSHWHAGLSIYLGDGIQHLCGLKFFEVEVDDAKVPLTSPSIQNLSLRRPHIGCMIKCPSFGALEKLQCLHLRFFPSLQECLPMAGELVKMPHLKELLLMKGFHSANDVVFDACGTFERLLLSLSQVTSLENLQVIAMNDSVSLSRKVVPQVKHFSLAARGVAVCSSLFSSSFSSVNLAFCNASQNTLELLGNHTEVSQSFEQDIKQLVRKAVLTQRGSSVFEFPLDVFEAFCECECPEAVEEIQYADLS